MFLIVFLSNATHVRHGLRGLRAGCGWSVTDFWGWDAHEAGLRCPMRWMVIYEYGVPGWALNLNSTNYPDHGHHGDPSLSGKNPNGRAGNQTRDLMLSSQKRWPLDHEVGLFFIVRLGICWDPTSKSDLRRSLIDKLLIYYRFVNEAIEADSKYRPSVYVARLRNNTTSLIQDIRRPDVSVNRRHPNAGQKLCC
jgi:hypothetical protein